MSYPKKIKVGELTTYFAEYSKELKANPFIITDYVGKDGLEVDRKKEKPLTWEGFENYLFKKGIINDLCDYVNNRDEAYNDYQPEVKNIKRIIRQDQIEGGMAMIYSQNITARLQQLKEHIESNNSVSILNIDPLDDSANNGSTKDSKSS